MHRPCQVGLQALPETADPTAEYQHVASERGFSAAILYSTSFDKIGEFDDKIRPRN